VIPRFFKNGFLAGELLDQVLYADALWRRRIQRAIAGLAIGLGCQRKWGKQDADRQGNDLQVKVLRGEVRCAHRQRESWVRHNFSYRISVSLDAG
jgi:hypothetical protein